MKIFAGFLFILVVACGCATQPALQSKWEVERFRVLFDTASDNPATQAKVDALRGQIEELYAFKTLGGQESLEQEVLRDEEIAKLERQIKRTKYFPVEEFPEEGSLITLELAPEAEGAGAFGKAGCNEYYATYAATPEQKLSFEGLMVGDNVCRVPVGVMSQELKFLRILNDVESYEINNGRLTLNADMEGLVLKPTKSTK